MTAAHVHDRIELIYVLAGSCEAYLGNSRYCFSKGDLLLINSGEVHKISALTDKESKYICLKFAPELLYVSEQTVFETKYVLPFLLSSFEHQKVFTASELCASPVPKIMKTILSEYDAKEYGFELAIRAQICSLFLWILRRWKNQGLDLSPDSTIAEVTLKKFQRVFDFIEQNYQNPITANDAAEVCGFSYSHFSRLFKSVMKMGFTHYLTSVRISKAEILLLETDKSITEIAMECGFSTSSYFIAQFKKLKNVSPKAYRKLFSKNT